jgi:CTP:phosphocholine cytidylyltransferase-like protein
LTVDAKNRNTDLDSALTILGSAKDITTITGVYKRLFDYTITIDGDRVVYEGQYRFYNLA